MATTRPRPPGRAPRPASRREYRVCNRLLDPETNEHCEFDGDVDVNEGRTWRCPACRAVHW